MRDAPTQRAGSDAEGEPSQPDRRARFLLPVLALLSALFFAGALAYAIGGGFLGGRGDEGAGLSDRSKRALPRDWANLIPLQPVDPDLRPESGTAGASEDSGSRSPDADDPSGGQASGPGPAPALAAAGAPSALSAVPRRVPLLRDTARRVPALADLTPSSVPKLGGPVPDIDLPGGGVNIPPILPGGVDIPPILPGGVDIPPVLPGGVNIPPILPGGVDLPPVEPLPGVPVVPPVDPLPGGGGPPLPGGLPSPGGVVPLGDGQGLSAARGVVPVLPLVSVASLPVDDESPSAGEAPTREAAPREGRGGTASAASKRRAARALAVRKTAVVKTSLAPGDGTRSGGPRRARADSDERPRVKQQGTSKDCDLGPDQEPSGSTDPGCGETPAGTGGPSDRKAQREPSREPSRDRAARAEGEEGS